MRIRIIAVLFVLFILQLLMTRVHAQGLADATTFQARLKDPGAQVVDVRTAEEFAKGHIAGALNNDWLENGFMERARTLDPAKPVLVYCAAGGRSEEAAAALRKAGFTNVTDLRGGFMGWRKQGLPVSND